MWVHTETPSISRLGGYGGYSKNKNIMFLHFSRTCRQNWEPGAGKGSRVLKNHSNIVIFLTSRLYVSQSFDQLFVSSLFLELLKDTSCTFLPRCVGNMQTSRSSKAINIPLITGIFFTLYHQGLCPTPHMHLIQNTLLEEMWLHVRTFFGESPTLVWRDKVLVLEQEESSASVIVCWMF